MSLKINNICSTKKVCSTSISYNMTISPSLFYDVQFTPNTNSQFFTNCSSTELCCISSGYYTATISFNTSSTDTVKFSFEIDRSDNQYGDTYIRNQGSVILDKTVSGIVFNLGYMAAPINYYQGDTLKFTFSDATSKLSIKGNICIEKINS